MTLSEQIKKVDEKHKGQKGIFLLIKTDMNNINYVFIPSNSPKIQTNVKPRNNMPKVRLGRNNVSSRPYLIRRSN
jgi:hypothetical protein